MRVVIATLLFVCTILVAFSQRPLLDGIKSYPFPADLTSCAQGAKVAWTFNEQGRRNVYVAEGPDFKPRKLTAFDDDEGQEITSLSISNNGEWVVFVRGGDHGSNWDDGLPVNPAASPTPFKVSVMSVPFGGGKTSKLSEGDEPVVSPDGKRVAFVKGGQVWSVPTDGSSESKPLFTSRGNMGDLQWSPDGSSLAFVSARGDHSFIGIYTNEQAAIRWVSPSFHFDVSPRWSPDGRSLAFVRQDGNGGGVDSVLARRHTHWSIRSADAASGKSVELWSAPRTLRGSVPTTHGGYNLHWAARNRIVFLSYQDGWPHLYSIPAQGGEALLLTPGNFMAEHITLSPDKQFLVFAANTGKDALDIDRRHVVSVSVDKANPAVLTPGTGLEWFPVVTGDGQFVFCVSATPQRCPLPAVVQLKDLSVRILAKEMVPATFPESRLVVPRQVTFKSSDGLTIHGQLFEPTGANGKRPAIVYIHGGPPRQMLLGWHYSDYYSNAYATNQYLASQGFVVLSVNYRLGIGYGFDFHRPTHAGAAGASEYLDIKAAGEWLAAQTSVDASKIGVYGGSYGGYLTAMALAKDSKLFAAGVDVHGVHDFTVDRTRSVLLPDRFERAPDAELAARTAWQSSPVAWLSGWTSPALMIHADDDRNVRFNQSTDLVQRLWKKGVAIETLVIVDDTHHWMMHRNALTLDQAIADYFSRVLMGK
ncbi:MAG: prolyl oligopeptidase family serine peptidase [Cyclobacteriaceae bacterium]|nr:prolyl oligopeptidase family serine peptidase [Cyclobacteriaceae bacterium]